MSEIVTADEVRLRKVLSENGLPTKLGVKLNFKEFQLHTILCKTYNFQTSLVELEVPDHFVNKLTDNFHQIWVHKMVGRNQGKPVLLFKLHHNAVKQTIKTALVQDKGIFNSKVNTVPLHGSWSKYINLPSSTDTKHVPVDWGKAEKHAKKVNEHTKQQILDGKTFNAQKDNPWARKNLKNKNQN